MTMKRQALQQLDTAQCLEEAQPALKRLRLSSTEPDVDCPDHQLQNFLEHFTDQERCSTAGKQLQLQELQGTNSYCAMNALLKQLHMERVQRLQVGSSHSEAQLHGS